MKFNVTQKDIDKGIRSNISKCPVARSISRTLGIKGVVVAGTYVTVKGELYTTPSAVEKFVGAFDAYGPLNVKPFSFSIAMRGIRPRAKKQSARLAKGSKQLISA